MALGFYEKKSIVQCKKALDSSNLLQIETKSAFFTWTRMRFLLLFNVNRSFSLFRALLGLLGVNLMHCFSKASF